MCVSTHSSSTSCLTPSHDHHLHTHYTSEQTLWDILLLSLFLPLLSAPPLPLLSPPPQPAGVPLEPQTLSSGEFGPNCGASFSADRRCRA